MASGLIEGMRQEGAREEVLDLYLSAKTYRQCWEPIRAASRSIRENDFRIPGRLLREAPRPETRSPSTPSLPILRNNLFVPGGPP